MHPFEFRALVLSESLRPKSFKLDPLRPRCCCFFLNFVHIFAFFVWRFLRVFGSVLVLIYHRTLVLLLCIFIIIKIEYELPIEVFECK